MRFFGLIERRHLWIRLLRLFVKVVIIVWVFSLKSALSHFFIRFSELLVLALLVMKRFFVMDRLFTELFKGSRDYFRLSFIPVAVSAFDLNLLQTVIIIQQGIIFLLIDPQFLVVFDRHLFVELVEIAD